MGADMVLGGRRRDDRIGAYWIVRVVSPTVYRAVVSLVPSRRSLLEFTHLCARAGAAAHRLATPARAAKSGTLNAEDAARAVVVINAQCSSGVRRRNGSK